jgi:hypothetical protein
LAEARDCTSILNCRVDAAEFRRCWFACCGRDQPPTV